MTKKFRCEVCNKYLKQINETNQYYCDQPSTKCYNSLKVIHK